MNYQYAHEDVLGGVEVSGSDTVTIAIVRGPGEAASTRDVEVILTEHRVDVDGYEVAIVFVRYSYTELYAIMYVLPADLDIDIAATHVSCGVDVLNNRVSARFDPLTPAITARAAELWGSMIAVSQMPADAPRLRVFPGGTPAGRRVRLHNSPGGNRRP